MQDFFALTLRDLEGFCQQQGVSSQHASTLYRRVYKDGDRQPWQTDTLPRRLQQDIGEKLSCGGARIALALQSRYDGTVKFLIEMIDGARVEAVLMPEKKRITLCISSQVGCAQACTFCYTGRMGLTRQLSAGEIVAQVYLAREWLREHPEWLAERGFSSLGTVSNIVFMGMGEPLDNVAAVMQSLRILCEPMGMNMALRKISVSTAGHFDGLRELLSSFPEVSLALSLHATSERERTQLMPINRRWPITSILSFLREFYRAQGGQRSLLVQYTVIRGVNDSPRHAQELLELLEGIPVKLNLIPLNEVEPSRFQGPEPQSLATFRDLIYAGGMRVMVRYSKGQDIEAACGQLVIKHQETVVL